MSAEKKTDHGGYAWAFAAMIVFLIAIVICGLKIMKYLTQ